jgi:hypothetical protein
MDLLIHHLDQPVGHQPSQGAQPTDPRALARAPLSSRALTVARPHVDRRVRPTFIPHAVAPNSLLPSYSVILRSE